MKKRAFAKFCACEILFSNKLTTQPVDGNVLKIDAIRAAEKYGLHVGKPKTGASWAITFLTLTDALFVFVKRVKRGVYVITAKGNKYRHSHDKNEFYADLCKQEKLRSKKWHAAKRSKGFPKETLQQVTVRLNGRELSGDLESVSKIVARVTA